MRVRAGIFIAAASCRHKLMQQGGFLLNLGRAGDQVGSIVIGNTIACDWKNIQLYTIALGLDNFPSLIDPDKIYAV